MDRFDKRTILYVILFLAALAGEIIFGWLAPPIHTRSQILLHIGISVFPIFLVFLIFRNEKRVSWKGWLLLFSLLIAIYLFVDPFGSQLLPYAIGGFLPKFFSTRPNLSRFIALAGHGLLVPALVLIPFIAVLLFKYKRG